MSTEKGKKRVRAGRQLSDPVTLGRRLKEARERAGLTQRQLSSPGCTHAYISRLESGERWPSLQLVRELARRLGVSEEYLAYGDEGGDPLLEADLALRMDEGEAAERLYRAELESDDPARRAQALAGLGQLAFRRGQLREAIELFEHARELYGKRAITERALVDTLGRCYAQVGELESAIALYEQALQAAEEREDVLDGVRFSVLLSYALADSGQLARAEQLVASALTHADELADPQARVRLYWAQCRLHILAGRSDLAERYGRKLIELLELSEDRVQLARAHSLLANVALDRKRPQEALELLERSRALLGESANEAEAATITLNEARALAQLGEIERAAALAVEASGPLQDRPEEAGQSYTVLAKTLAEAGDRARAIELLELACEFLERNPNRFLVEAYSQLAELLEAEGKKEEAFELLKKTVGLQSTIGLPAAATD